MSVGPKSCNGWSGQPARPTTYSGIKMRSRLEATYAAELDQLGIQWEYEPRCFANPTGQYLPDFHEWFEIEGTRSVGVYVEVKPLAPPGPATEAIQRRMEIIWSSEPEAHLTIWTPQGRWSVCPPGLHHSIIEGWSYTDGSTDEDEVL